MKLRVARKVGRNIMYRGRRYRAATSRKAWRIVDRLIGRWRIVG